MAAQDGPRQGDYRTLFQIDRDRVIHAHAFRKLQSKTQVFLSGEYDFYRTRLTHSIEVAQIGRSICHYLRVQGGPLREDFHIDGELVEGVCLAHDLGHPPFGHSGERTLQELMLPYGGFEGNAQTLHLLTSTLYENETGMRGMQATRALLDGVLKYKKLFREFPTPPENHFLYDTQEGVRAFVFDEAIPAVLQTGELLNGFKSVECQIMDWADDAAYSLNDIVDGVKAGFLTIERIEQWAAGEGIDAVWTMVLAHRKALGDSGEAEARRRNLAKLGVARYGLPEEIGQAVCFLASPVAAGYANGAIIDIDGGQTRHI